MTYYPTSLGQRLLNIDSNGTGAYRAVTVDNGVVSSAELEASGGVLYREVNASLDNPDSILIESSVTDVDGRPVRSRVVGTMIQDSTVAEAIRSATRAALLSNGLDRTEAAQLERLRQDVARFGVNDGRFDELETQQIVQRSQRIGRANS